METFCMPDVSAQCHCCSHCFRSSCSLSFCNYAAQNYRCNSELALHLNGNCVPSVQCASMHHMIPVLGKIYCLLFHIRSSHKLKGFLSSVPLPSDGPSIVNVCISSFIIRNLSPLNTI